MAQTRHDQLMNFMPSYRAGYISGGGRDEQLRDENELMQRMEAANVQNERDAEQAGRQDGYDWRQANKGKKLP